jgi:hypothetical protein
VKLSQIFFYHSHLNGLSTSVLLSTVGEEAPQLQCAKRAVLKAGTAGVYRADRCIVTKALGQDRRLHARGMLGRV